MKHVVISCGKTYLKLCAKLVCCSGKGRAGCMGSGTSGVSSPSMKLT